MVMQGSCDNKRTIDLNEGYYGRDGFVNTYISKIQDTFKLSPSYFQVTKNSDLTTLYDVWIQEIKDKNEEDGVDKKSIIMYPGQILNRGDYINWTTMGETFLITGFNINSYYGNGIAERCNNKLKFKNSKGVIVEYPCVTTVIGRVYLGTIDNNYVTIPKDTYLINIQNNIDTQEIIESQRFIVSGQPLKTMAKSKILLQGVIQFKMYSDLVFEGDDLVNNIAVQTIPQSNTPPSNLAISGLTSIKINNSTTYTITNNTNSNTFSWSIVDAITGNSTTYASIRSTTDTSCVVQVGSTSGKQVKLIATCKENPSTVLTLIISVIASF